MSPENTSEIFKIFHKTTPFVSNDFTINDLEDVLFRNGIILACEDITDSLATRIITQLTLFGMNFPKQPLTMIINSDGGNISSGFAIHDMMKSVPNPIRTIGMGNVYSMAAIMLAAGTVGQRYSFPNTRIMIHDPSTSANGSTEDLVVNTKELVECRKIIHRLLALYTNKTIKEIEKHTKVDYYMNAHQAIKYGIIDGVLI